MDKCYDGVKDLPKPPPTLPPKRTVEPVIAREVAEVAESYHCSDTEYGMGQFQKDNGVFTSFNYPKPYPNNEFCYYCVSPAEEGGYVKVSQSTSGKTTKTCSQGRYS